MKKIEIEIPEGKEVKWVGDTLKLVDAPKPIIYRIKTVQDAVDELTNRDTNHPLLLKYARTIPLIHDLDTDLVAYLKLRIIVAALNEGWEPQFNRDEKRWYPCFSYVNCDFVSVGAGYDSSYSYGSGGSLLAFKSKKLAEYAAKQFIELYKQFLYKN